MNWFITVSATTESGKLFHILIMRLLKKYFLKSQCHLFTSSLRLFPLVWWSSGEYSGSLSAAWLPYFPDNSLYVSIMSSLLLLSIGKCCAACSAAATIWPSPPQVITCRPYSRSGWFSVTALSGLVTLTFELLTLKLVLNVTRGTDHLPLSFVLLRLFFVELWANTRQTDDVTL